MGPHPSARRVDRRFAVLLVIPIAAAIAAGATFAFSSSSSVSHHAGAKGANAVEIQNFAFHPPTITVAPGSTLTVTNADQTTHTFTAINGSFNSGDLNGGASMTITAPTKPGTYAYRCNIHQYMHGVLKVGP